MGDAATPGPGASPPRTGSEARARWRSVPRAARQAVARRDLESLDDAHLQSAHAYFGFVSGPGLWQVAIAQAAALTFGLNIFPILQGQFSTALGVTAAITFAVALLLSRFFLGRRLQATSEALRKERDRRVGG